MSEYQEQPFAIASLSLNTFFDLIRHPRRRAVLAQLLTHERKLTVNDLTKELVVQEQDAPITEVAGDELTQIQLSLQHTHIPKLAETPLIGYDDKRNIVEPTDQLDQLRPFLSAVIGADSVQSLCRN